MEYGEQKPASPLCPWHLRCSRYSASVDWWHFPHSTGFGFSVRENQWVYQHRFYPESKPEPLPWFEFSMPWCMECPLFCMCRSGITFILKCPSLFSASFVYLWRFFQFLMRGASVVLKRAPCFLFLFFFQKNMETFKWLPDQDSACTSKLSLSFLRLLTVPANSPCWSLCF